MTNPAAHGRRAATALVALAVPGALVSPSCASASSAHRAASPVSTSVSTSAATGTGRVATARALPLKGIVIGVDAGHNGGFDARQMNRLVNAGFGMRKACNTTGTETNAGYTEHAHNWDVAGRLRRDLTALGATVVMTRTSDTGIGPCIDVRAATLTRAHTMVNISIHADGNMARTARGFHVIHGTRAVGGSAVVSASSTLAVDIRDAFQATTMPRSTYIGHGTGLSARDDLAATNLATAPTVMIETGNMRNAADAHALGLATFRQREADALTRGLRTWLHR